MDAKCFKTKFHKSEWKTVMKQVTFKGKETNSYGIARSMMQLVESSGI